MVTTMKPLDSKDVQTALHHLRTEPEGTFAKNYLRYLRQFKPSFHDTPDDLLVEKAIGLLCGTLN